MKQRYKKTVATLTAAATALAVVGLITVVNQEAVVPAQAAIINVSGLQSLDIPGSIGSKAYIWNMGTDSLFESPDKAMDQVWQTVSNATNGVSQLNYPALVLPVDSMTWNGSVAYAQPEGYAGPGGVLTTGWEGVWSPEGDLKLYGIYNDPSIPNSIYSDNPVITTANFTNLSGVEATESMDDGKTYTDEQVCPDDGTPIAGARHTTAVWNAWCHGPMRYTVTITKLGDTDMTLGPLPYGMTWNLGTTTEFKEEFPDASGFGGPNNPQMGNLAQGSNYIASIAPRLQVKKQVCEKYDDEGNPLCTNESEVGWVEDTTNGDKLDPNLAPDDPANLALSGIDGGVEEYVEEGQVPPGTTTLLWRVTAYNTGNVPLTGIHVGDDALSFQPGVGDDTYDQVNDNTCKQLKFDNAYDGSGYVSTYQKDAAGKTLGALGVGVFDPDDPGNVFYQYFHGYDIDDSGALMPGNQISQTCTTHMDDPFSGIVQNTVGLNASFDNPDAPVFITPDAYITKYNDAGEVFHDPVTHLIVTDSSVNLMKRFMGYGDEEGQVPSNLDSAQVTIPNPMIKLTKWVCTQYDENNNPACTTTALTQGSDDLLSMAGVGADPKPDKTYPVTLGTAPEDSGWAKTTTVPYESDALWLMIATNIGNVPVTNIDFTTEDVIGEAGTSGPIQPVDVPDILAAGASAMYTMRTSSIIDTGTPQGSYVEGDDTYAAYGEKPWKPGDDVVNTAVVTADALNKDQTPMIANGQQVTAVSNPSSAEANTGVPSPALKVTKWVCSIGTGCSYDLNDGQLQQLSGVNRITTGSDKGKLNVEQGRSVVGTTAEGVDWAWLPETVVSYNTDAEWLVVVTNIGDASLGNIQLTDKVPSGAGQNGTSMDSPPVIDQSTGHSLASGNSIAYRLITSGITSSHMNVEGYEIDSLDAGAPWFEPDRLNGDDSVINTASATGTTWDVVHDKPLPQPGTDNPTWLVDSNTSTAEVNTISLAIGDYVWYDATASGIQPDAPQDGRHGVPNVRVDLLKVDPLTEDSTLVETKTTDPTGFYYFDQLAPGTYQVAFYLPVGYTWTTPLVATGLGDDFNYASRDSDAVTPLNSSNDRVRVSGLIDMNISTLADYGQHANVAKLADAAIPDRYKETVQAEFINPTIDAGLISVNPDLKVTKWVCSRVDAPCDAVTAPADPDDPSGPTVLDSLAGYNAEQGEIAGTPAGGWAKEATVTTGTDAQWLIVATNTGNTTLRDVKLDDNLAGTEANEANGHGATRPVTPASVDTLEPGQSAVFTLTTSDITNSNDVVPGIDEAGQVSHGEPTYKTGESLDESGAVIEGESSVVNKVTATGVPYGHNAVTGALEPILIPGTTEPVPSPVSNQSSAEVNSLGFAIGDYMWFDANGNGRQEVTEAPVKGATVSLYSIVEGKQDAKLQEKTTNDQGLYLFDNLPAGSYQVVFTLPAGYVWTTTRAEGVEVEYNSDAAQTTGQSEIIVLGVNDSGIPPVDSTIRLSSTMDYPVNAKWIDPTIDAGILLPQPGLKITKWVCTDFTDGCDDPTGADLVAMAGYDSTGVHPGVGKLNWDKEATAPDETTPVEWLIVVTNTGKQTLDNVTLDDHYTQDIGAGDKTCTSDVITLAPGESALYHCTTDYVTNTQPYETGVVSGSTPDPIFGEPEYATGDDVVNAAQATGNPVDPAGHPIYQVDENGNLILDDDQQPIPVVTQSNVSEAEANVVSYAVGDYVWYDANGDGFQDPGETGVEGMYVLIYRASDNTLAGTAQTDADGWYYVDLLNSGSYYAQFEAMPGYLWTKYLQGEDRAIDSDAGFAAITDPVAKSPIFALKAGDSLLVPSSAAPEAYRDEIKATYINPTIDAGIIEASPGIDLAKYVCSTGTGCTVPASFTSLNAPAGWVKAQTISYDTDADWLVIIQNTGNVPLQDVKLIREDFLAGSSEGFDPGTCVLPANAADVLAPGAYVPWTCTATHVTNTAEFGTHQDVVNTARAQGTPVDANNNPLRNSDGTIRTVISKEDSAEVRTDAFAVGDFVWFDANGDGFQDPADPAETGVGGVTVTLRTADNTVVATTTTDPSGWYYFDLLKPGNYNIQFTLKDDQYLWTKVRAGTTEADTLIDSDAGFALPTDRVATSTVFTLSTDGTNVVPRSDAPEAYRDDIKATYINPSIDAGLILANPGIALTKYVCSTGTGCTTPTVYLSLDAPNSEWVKQTTVTYDTSADWLILIKNTGNVPLADVSLSREDFLAGGEGFDPDTCVMPTKPIDDTLDVGEIISWKCTITNVTNTENWETGKDIVNTAIAQGTPVYGDGPAPEPIVSEPDTAEVNTELFAVGDYVWIDANGDGFQDPTDPAETGIENVPVSLLDKDKNVVATTETDPNGYYYFDKLVPGDYQVRFSLPDGYMWTKALAGDSKIDSDAAFTDNFQETSDTAVFTLDKDSTALIPTSQAPADYRDAITASRINPTIDAGVGPVAPNIALKKYVCTDGTGCTTDVTQFASFDNPGHGWVESTTVTYDFDADWLVLIANTGNVDLQNVNLIVEDLNVGGAGFSGQCDIPDDPIIALLPVGEMVSYTCTITHVTNTADLGSGHEIINEAQAEGTPVDHHGRIVHQPGKPAGPIPSNKDRARVHARPPASNPPESPSESPSSPSESPTSPSESPTTPSNTPTTPSNTPSSPSSPPSSPSEPPTSPSCPSEPPSSPSEPPTSPSGSPSSPSSPPMSPSCPPTSPSESPTSPSNTPTSPSSPPTTPLNPPYNPPTSPSESPTSPSESPTSPSSPPTSPSCPSEPPTSPSGSPSSPSSPPMSPSCPPTSPSESPTSPSNTPTSPSSPPTTPFNPPLNPPMSPTEPPTSPTEPPTSPSATPPSTTPTTPPPSSPPQSSPSTPPPPRGIGTGGSAQPSSNHDWAIPLFMVGVIISIGAVATRKHVN